LKCLERLLEDASPPLSHQDRMHSDSLTLCFKSRSKFRWIFLSLFIEPPTATNRYRYGDMLILYCSSFPCANDLSRALLAFRVLILSPYPTLFRSTSFCSPALTFLALLWCWSRYPPPPFDLPASRTHPKYTPSRSLWPPTLSGRPRSKELPFLLGLHFGQFSSRITN